MARPRSQPRGFTILLALGLVAVSSLAVAVGLSVVGGEASAQAASRRQREAFFAAEAGLAEARAVLRELQDVNAVTFNPAIERLGQAVNEPGLGAGPASDPWFDVLGGWQAYTLLDGAMDANVTAAGRELVAPNGQPFLSFPEQRAVRYRVFLRDDADDANPAEDGNGQVWLVAVGEVTSAQGQATRAVVQALIDRGRPTNRRTIGCVGAHCGPDMSSNNSAEVRGLAAGTTVRSL